MSKLSKLLEESGAIGPSLSSHPKGITPYFDLQVAVLPRVLTDLTSCSPAERLRQQIESYSEKSLPALK